MEPERNVTEVEFDSTPPSLLKAHLLCEIQQYSKEMPVFLLHVLVQRQQNSHEVGGICVGSARLLQPAKKAAEGREKHSSCSTAPPAAALPATEPPSAHSLLLIVVTLASVNARRHLSPACPPFSM